MLVAMDEVCWTEAGHTLLKTERAGPGVLDTADRGQLEATIRAVIERYAHTWARGLARADETGRRAAEVATQFDTHAPPTSATELAMAVSLFHARGDGDSDALTELVLREHGWPVALEMLARSWAMSTRYKDPGWPKSEDQLEVWLEDAPSEGARAFDASVSYGKYHVARYLSERHGQASEKDQRAAAAFVEKRWSTASEPQRVALVAATRDAVRAEEVVGQEAEGPAVHGSCLRLIYPLIANAATLTALEPHELPLRYAHLDVLGEAVIPLFEARIRSRIHKSVRLELLEQLANLRGPRTAHLMAIHAERPPYTKLVRAYFLTHPTLWSGLGRADHPELGKLEVKLDKLEAWLTKHAGKPGLELHA